MDELTLIDAHLIDGTGRDPVDRAWLRIEHGRVIKVGRSPAPTTAGPVVDCAGRTVLPGLIDCHTHLAAADLLNRVHLLPRAVLAARTFRALWDTLAGGFTTVRDAGFTDYGFKEAVRQGEAIGPRLRLATGPLSQTGGHSDFRTRDEQPLRRPDGLYHPGVVADGVDACRRAAREVLRRGADQLKVMASGGCTSPTDHVDHPQYTRDELRAITYEAGARGTYVMAHAYTPESIIRCVASGVRSIEHGNGVDERAAAAMRASGTFAVPTIATYELLSRDGAALGLPADQLAQVKQVLAVAYQGLEIMRDAGVPIASGSDLLGHHQPQQAYELECKARVLGTMGALVAATRTSAELLGLGGELGTLTPGKLADLVVLDANPLAEIRALQDRSRIHLVMAADRVIVDRIRGDADARPGPAWAPATFPTPLAAAADRDDQVGRDGH